MYSRIDGGDACAHDATWQRLNGPFTIAAGKAELAPHIYLAYGGGTLYIHHSRVWAWKEQENGWYIQFPDACGKIAKQFDFAT